MMERKLEEKKKRENAKRKVLGKGKKKNNKN
jgi:hypothetical protein